MSESTSTAAPKSRLNDIHVNAEDVLITPNALREELPLPEAGRVFVKNARQIIANIIHKQDHRLLVITGPCSVHDVEAAKAYARKLKVLHDKYQDSLYIVMRVYFEKPRTTVGWKGLINDPHMDGSFDVESGLRKARELLIYLTELGLPLATEALDPISPQYLAELFSWSAIGARTTESQTHREMASGLSMPVGFKNGTDGTIKVAIDAIGAASASHHFLSVTKYGHSAIVETTGNEDCHIILRGGKTTNYDAESVKSVTEQLSQSKLNTHIMIDFSHANSSKKFENQMLVCRDVCQQMADGNHDIFGVMVESHLVEGRQDLIEGKAPTYGQSITDACIGWQDTETLLAELDQAVVQRREKS